MSQPKTIQFAPDTQFSAKDLDTFLRELEVRFKQKEVMHRKECAEYLGLSERTVDRLSSAGSLPYHTLEGLNCKFYLRSEVVEHLKSRK